MFLEREMRISASRFIYFLTAISAFLVAPIASMAAGLGQGTVTQVVATQNSGLSIPSVVFITISQVSGTPSCNTQGTFAINLATPAGQAMYSAALMAYSQGTHFTII